MNKLGFAWNIDADIAECGGVTVSAQNDIDKRKYELFEYGQSAT